ncbi:MAG: tellurite resistance TerB family protein [Gammaproteobacteria bacterium]|nr:tellurite resistance TerB family protein [Gammaproteobacteria bacterium]
MNTKGLLDQLFKQGSALLSGSNSAGAASSGASGSGGLAGLLSGKAGAALGGGAIGLLLGSKKGRKMGGKILTYGGLAALGVVAYKAYSNYQQQQGAKVSQAEPQTIDRLPAVQAEQHSHAILRAIIAAAKADGHIDDRERELIDNEIARLTSDGSLQHWFDAELKKPLDPADIAQSAATPEMAAEMYLASVLVVDEENFMERSYLAELARQLKLDPVLKTELEQQARQAAV